MTVNEERVALLADALESGEYEQGRSFLHTRNPVPDGQWQHRWCCLGVAGNIAHLHGLEFERHFAPYGENSEKEYLDGSDQVLGPLITDWYGFSSSNPWLLAPAGSLLRSVGAAAWNDCPDIIGLDTSFAAIGAGFRATYLGGSRGTG